MDRVHDFPGHALAREPPGDGTGHAPHDTAHGGARRAKKCANRRAGHCAGFAPGYPTGYAARALGTGLDMRMHPRLVRDFPVLVAHLGLGDVRDSGERIDRRGDIRERGARGRGRGGVGCGGGRGEAQGAA